MHAGRLFSAFGCPADQIPLLWLGKMARGEFDPIAAGAQEAALIEMIMRGFRPATIAAFLWHEQ